MSSTHQCTPLTCRFDVRRPNPVSHGGTFNNSALTMVAGATALEQILTPEALSNLNALGDTMRDMLDSGFQTSGAPFKVTGLGSVNQIHCTLANELRNSAHDLLFFVLLERGYWTAQRGTLALNFQNTREDAEEFVAAVVDAAQAVTVAANGN